VVGKRPLTAGKALSSDTSAAARHVRVMGAGDRASCTKRGISSLNHGPTTKHCAECPEASGPLFPPDENTVPGAEAMQQIDESHMSSSKAIDYMMSKELTGVVHPAIVGGALLLGSSSALFMHMTGRPQIAAAVLVLTIFLYLFAPVFVSGGTSDTSGGDSSTPQEKKKESTTLNLKQVFDPTTELPSLAMVCAGLALMASSAAVAHACALSQVPAGALLLVVACSIELMSPALYSILSCVIPVLMAFHLALTGRLMSLMQLGLFIPISLLYIGVPMSVCLHRYFSHQAFTTSRPMQFVLGVVACLAWQGGPLWWAMMHLRHHQHCDTPNDPHSAKQRGTLYAFLGWMANPVNYLADNVKAYQSLDEGLRVPEMLLLQKLNPLPPILLCLVANSYFGYVNMMWCFLGPMVNTRLTTLIFNVHFHPEDDKKTCKAIDDERILAMLVGESNHMDHHLWPSRARRKDWDVPWWITLSWMEATGLIWDCKYKHLKTDQVVRHLK